MAQTKTQLVITDTVETAGCITYMRTASETSLDILTAAWKAQGLDPKALPEPPEGVVALGRAVKSLSEKRQLVRPLEKRGAWAIVEETVKEGSVPTYRTLVTVHHETVSTLYSHSTRQVDATDLEWAQLSNEVLKAYTSAQNTLAHVDISTWLIKQAYMRGAVSLRESGGVYFIPRDKTEEWNKIAKALGSAGSDVFTIPAMKTVDAVAAITDAITAEAAAEAAAIEAEINKTGDDALGARALKTRVSTMEKLIAKLGTYEDLIGRALAIRERVEQVSANVSVAALKAMDEPEEK